MAHSIIPDTTLVRVTSRSSCGDPHIDRDAADDVGPWVVYTYAAEGEGDDPDGRPYYLLDVPGITAGGCYWAFPEHVEVLT